MRRFQTGVDARMSAEGTNQFFLIGIRYVITGGQGIAFKLENHAEFKTEGVF